MAKKVAALSLFLILVLGGLYLLNKNIVTTRLSVGSVANGSDYKSTTTLEGQQTPTVVAVGPGVLGNVVITKTGAGIMTFYDATTTNKTLRGNTSTTSITLTSFPTSPTIGTYIFDIAFYKGLIVDTPATSPSTTITYKWQ